MNAALYLKIIPVVFTLAIGIPLLFFPLRWAKLMRWQIPDHTDLAVYFGRCLGAVVTAVSAIFFRFAENAGLQPLMLEFLLVAFTLMALVHIWGFIRKIQPWTEHAEIPLYLVLAVCSGILRYG